ncbi:lipoprotein, partial [Streptomyces sp. RSD-27]
PAALPDDAAFAFGGDQEAMARAYEGAWLACRLVAARWGDAALVRLYESAGRAPLPTALDQALGTDRDALTKAWQEALRTELG